MSKEKQSSNLKTSRKRKSLVWKTVVSVSSASMGILAIGGFTILGLSLTSQADAANQSEAKSSPVNPPASPTVNPIPGKPNTVNPIPDPTVGNNNPPAKPNQPPQNPLNTLPGATNPPSQVSTPPTNTNTKPSQTTPLQPQNPSNTLPGATNPPAQTSTPSLPVTPPAPATSSPITIDPSFIVPQFDQLRERLNTLSFPTMPAEPAAAKVKASIVNFDNHRTYIDWPKTPSLPSDFRWNTTPTPGIVFGVDAVNNLTVKIWAEAKSNINIKREFILTYTGFAK